MVVMLGTNWRCSFFRNVSTKCSFCSESIAYNWRDKLDVNNVLNCSMDKLPQHCTWIYTDERFCLTKTILLNKLFEVIRFPFHRFIYYVKHISRYFLNQQNVLDWETTFPREWYKDLRFCLSIFRLTSIGSTSRKRLVNNMSAINID